MVKTRFALCAVGLLAAACSPDLNDRTSILDGPRVLAIRSEPAEAKPGTVVAYRALVGQAGSDPSWAFCTARKPLAELGPVSTECMQVSGESLVPFGEGFAASGKLPADGCRNFGPEAPTAKPGEPPGRPVDPDVTGGFQQPLRLLVDTPEGPRFSLGGTRLSCGLAGVTPEQLSEFQHRYVANENPELESVAVVGRGEALKPGDGKNQVRRGEKLALRASWKSCEAPPCAGAEPYVVFDPVSRTLVDRRESIRVAWFATAGAFEHDRTGRDGEDPTTFVDNAWTAPDAAGPVQLWVVIRDDRGGVGWLDYHLMVE
ncbi:hypothetical protein [Vulgatibacter incomptus]|uniref:Lipoprotein n=1 Tax=Vulgatibacter incomptus TaxID=1391653 RepID=A0A0K1PEZ7_9BACT|nr:hypothetical protein [Vulgatibacter incomptus]AKU92103.1 hypothetical protein AKJ08_2490 [Vulgatibacter incomptus]